MNDFEKDQDQTNARDEVPQKVFLTCPECHERALVEIPVDPAARLTRPTSWLKGHVVEYDERIETVLVPCLSEKA